MTNFEISQNDMEHLIDLVQRGVITAAQANVEKVKAQRILIVKKLTADIRKALNDAVKSGELGHKKKDGLKPEVYFHPSFEYLVNGELNRIALESVNSISKTIIHA